MLNPFLTRSLRILALAATLASSAVSQGAAEPVRVATLLPFVQDALAFASEQAVVVASVRRSIHAPLDAGIVDLGNPHSPNFEKLAEARPTLVIADRGVHGRFREALGGAGAEVLLIETSGIDSTYAALRQVSEAIGGSAALDARVAEVRAEIDSLEVEGGKRVLALFGSPSSFYIMTERAWLGDLIASLGLENAIDGVGDERFPGLVAVSDEIMALAQPDLVLVVAHGAPDMIRADLEKKTARGGAWAGLGRAPLGIHVLDPGLFAANPGLDLRLAARQLVKLASPNAGVAAK